MAEMKGIKLCGECGNYDWKKHKCKIGCNDDSNAQASFYGDCPLPDVVPKSEVDKLEYTLAGVMHSVDKWLDGEELKQDEVNRAITMREKTLRIIEGAKSKYENLKDLNKQLEIDNFNANMNCDLLQQQLDNAESKVAREIFEDIEDALAQMGICLNDETILYELKKKYTESEDKE